MKSRISLFHALLVLLLLLGAAMPVSAATVPTGNHIVVHFRMTGYQSLETAVLAVEDADGDLVLIATVQNNRLYLSDGSDNGTDRAYVQLSSAPVGSVWHRLDVVLHGSTYTAYYDQSYSNTARTFEPAPTGTWIADPRPVFSSTYESVEWDMQRADDSSMTYDETFASGTSTWSKHIDGGTLAQPVGLGHKGTGYVDLASGYGLGATYLRAPTAGLGSAYGLHASFASNSALLPPTGLAVFAGLTGTADAPTVEWSLVADRALPAVNQYALFLIDGDGTRTQVSPAWNDLAWHSVLASIDEANDKITLRIDGGTATTYSAELGASTHIGSGDVDAGPLTSLRSTARYDNLALFKEAN